MDWPWKGLSHTCRRVMAGKSWVCTFESDVLRITPQFNPVWSSCERRLGRGQRWRIFISIRFGRINWNSSLDSLGVKTTQEGRRSWEVWWGRDALSWLLDFPFGVYRWLNPHNSGRGYDISWRRFRDPDDAIGFYQPIQPDKIVKKSKPARQSDLGFI